MNVQAPEPLRLVSLRRDVDPPPQVLQTDGRRGHAAPASRVVGGSAEQQGPFAPRALPRFVATPDPSATLSPCSGRLTAAVRNLHRFMVAGARNAQAAHLTPIVISVP